MIDCVLTISSPLTKPLLGWSFYWSYYVNYRMLSLPSSRRILRHPWAATHIRMELQ